MMIGEKAVDTVGKVHDGRDDRPGPAERRRESLPRAAIDVILSRHTTIRDLVSKGWLSLFQLDKKERAVYALHGTQYRRQHAAVAAGGT